MFGCAMEIFILIFSFLFSVIGFGWELQKALQNKSFTIISLVGVMFIFTYGVLPFIVIGAYYWKDISISTKHYQYDYSDIGLMQTLIWEILGTISYIIIRFINRNVGSLLSRNNFYTDYSALQITTFLSLVIGVTCMYLWSMAFGGIQNLIREASKVRSGFSDVQNRFAFFKHFARVIIITCFSSLFLYKKKYNKLFNAILFIVSLIFSILFLLANDGRLSTLLFFVVVVFIVFDVFSSGNFSKKRFIFLCLIGGVGIFFIFKLDSITYYIRFGVLEPKSSRSFIESFMGEFAYVMISGQKAIDHAETWNWLIFDDILTGLQAWLPSSYKFINSKNIWDYNTLISTTNFVGQFPCDFISTSLYDFSYFGFAIFGVFWGFVIKRIEYLRTNNTLFSLVCYYSISTAFFRIVDYCMLYDFILGIFSIVLYGIVYLIVRLFTCKNKYYRYCGDKRL